MDIAISTTNNPYRKIWQKRGSRYLTQAELEAIESAQKGRLRLNGESNMKVGTATPFFGTEDLDTVIISEENGNNYHDDVCAPDYYDEVLVNGTNGLSENQ